MTIIFYIIIAFVVLSYIMQNTDKKTKEAFGQPVLREPDFGRSEYILNTRTSPPQTLFDRRKTFDLKDGAKLEYFFDRDEERDFTDPLSTSYKVIKESDVNTNTYGPKPWYDAKKYDEYSGTTPYNEIEEY